MFRLAIDSHQRSGRTSHGQAFVVGRVVGTDSDCPSCRAIQAAGWSTTSFRSRLLDGDSLRVEDGNSLGISPPGDELRLRNDLLAAVARLGNGRSVAEDLESVARRVGTLGRSESCLGRHRQLLGAGHFWGEKTGPNPTDRGKNGSKRHLMTDGDGLPLAIEHTGANVHDSELAMTLVDKVPAVEQPDGTRECRPQLVFADQAYNAEEKIRQPLRERGIEPLIGQRSDEHGSGLGIFRYVVESCLEWLFQWRRLRVRYEKRADIHSAFLKLACAMICWRKLEPFC